MAKEYTGTDNILGWVEVDDSERGYHHRHFQKNGYDIYWLRSYQPPWRLYKGGVPIRENLVYSWPGSKTDTFKVLSSAEEFVSGEIVAGGSKSVELTKKLIKEIARVA